MTNILTLSFSITSLALNSHKNYSTEAFVTANPDIILVTTQSLSAIGGKENLSQFPGIIHTNAWKSNRVIDIDQALILGMEPRIGDAVKILYNGFYPQLDHKSPLVHQ